MKTIPAGIQAKLNAGAATQCYCWIITRADATVMGFTDHDVSLVVDSVTCVPGAGFDATVLANSLGYASSDVTATGFIDADTITRSDILSGKYDDASVRLLWVDWSNPTDYVTMLSGFIGQIKVHGDKIEVEVKSLIDKLNRNIGRTYRRTCDAAFCDSRCGLSAASYMENGTITQVLADDAIVASGLADDYTNGVITFDVTSSRPGEIYTIRASVWNGTAMQLDFWSPMPIAPIVGDTFSILRGCDKSLKSCKAYSNIANFRGFPQIPGNDMLTQVPVPSDVGNYGGSMIVYE